MAVISAAAGWANSIAGQKLSLCFCMRVCVCVLTWPPLWTFPGTNPPSGMSWISPQTIPPPHNASPGPFCKKISRHFPRNDSPLTYPDIPQAFPLDKFPQKNLPRINCRTIPSPIPLHNPALPSPSSPDASWASRPMVCLLVTVTVYFIVHCCVVSLDCSSCLMTCIKVTWKVKVYICTCVHCTCTFVMGKKRHSVSFFTHKNYREHWSVGVINCPSPLIDNIWAMTFVWR